MDRSLRRLLIIAIAILAASPGCGSEVGAPPTGAAAPVATDAGRQGPGGSQSVGQDSGAPGKEAGTGMIVPSDGGDLQVYVSRQGSDDNPGTVDKPFASLEKARNALRPILAAGLRGKVTVLVHAGTYFLDAPLVFGRQDGGDATHAVKWTSFPGEQVVISAGRLVKGTWSKYQGDIWKVEIPEAKNGAWWFRDLFVDGQRATRARFEVRGDMVGDSGTTVELRDTLPVAISSADEAEVEIPGIWFSSREMVAQAGGRSLTLAAPIDGQGASVSWIENALAFIDRPGEWYLDKKTGTLYYQDEPGKSPSTRTFVAGRLDKILVIEGDAGGPVQNLHFSDLSFLHTTWQYDPGAGYNEKWAGTYGLDETKLHQLPLAIDVELAEGVSFEGVRVGHVGSSGIGFGRGVANSKIVGSEIYDAAGNCVVAGFRGKINSDGTLPQDVTFNDKWFPANGVGVDDLSLPWGSQALVPRDNEIIDNHVHHCGQVYEGTVGVHVQFQFNPRVEHNDVHDVNYAGMTFEMYKGDSRSKNVYSFNHVHDVMFLGNDGDFIYHSASIMGCEVRGNYAEGGGIYLDYHGSGNLVADNVVDHFRLNSPMQDMMNNVEMPSAAQKVAAAMSTGPREPYRTALANVKEPVIAAP